MDIILLTLSLAISLINLFLACFIVYGLGKMELNFKEQLKLLMKFGASQDLLMKTYELAASTWAFIGMKKKPANKKAAKKIGKRAR